MSEGTKAYSGCLDQSSSETTWVLPLHSVKLKTSGKEENFSKLVALVSRS
jgi:hypothetical protein